MECHAAWLSLGLCAAPVERLSTGEPEPEPQPSGPSPRPGFRTDRADGRFLSSAGFVHAYLKHHPPRLAFDPKMGAADFAAWQGTVRAKLRQVARFPDVPPQPPPKHLGTVQRDGYEVQRWEAYPEPLSVVPFLALVPTDAGPTAPRPAVLCLPGSGYTKESLAGEPELGGGPPTGVPGHDNMAQWYAQAGMVAVAVDNPAIGETADPLAGPDEISLYLVWAGRSYETLSAFQKLPILAWLRQQTFIAANRIAVSGHSLGAKPALLLGLLDPSLSAVVWNDSVVRWRERAVVCNLGAPFVNRQFIPELIEWFDYPDLMAALAPRPFLIGEGGRTADIERVRQAYRLVGAEANLQVAYYPRYATPDLRPLDHQDMPEGLSLEEYLRYVNVDPPGHWFKENVVVPWLSRVLGIR